MPAYPPFAPELSDGLQALVRAAYGALLLVFLVLTLPHRKRFFISERFGGYARSEPAVDRLQNPRVYPLLMVVWLACALLLLLGRCTVPAALINLVLCRYFFIWMRWRGVLRGMGAPGFMTYWLAGAVFLLEVTRLHMPDLRPLALLVLQVDFALIILSAGVYKFTAGYPRNHGMELGLVNPEWGYWWRWYRQRPPDHRLFWIMNQLAWSTEVVAVVLMLLPSARALGGWLIVLSFAFIATQIRLGVLCELVMLCGLLYLAPGAPGEPGLASLVTASAWMPEPAPPLLAGALTAALWSYLILLPLAHGGIFYNFYRRKSLPAPLQRALEAYTNCFGIIIWRVFSVDLINFFIRVYRAPRGGGDRTLLSRYGIGGDWRYNHVGEAITVTSLFTTLKYFPSNRALLHERVLRYARTVPCSGDEILIFEYVSIQKTPAQFEFVTVAEYHIDPSAGTIEERLLSDAVSVRAAHPDSPIHEGTRPGSYLPLPG